VRRAMKELKTKQYRVRRPVSGFKYGAEVTLPADWAKDHMGEMVTAIYDGVVIYVPSGVEVDEELIKRAIRKSHKIS